MALVATLVQSLVRGSSDRRKRRSGTRWFAAEGCEQRLLLAGNVTAVFDQGNLTITGDNLNNSIVVKADNGQLTIRGVEGTTINGSADPLTIGITGNEIPGNVTINLGSGNDSVVVGSLKVLGTMSAIGGAGNDKIAIGSTDVTGDLLVELDAGNDFLALDEITADDLIINGPQGKNSLYLATFDVKTLQVFLGSGKDLVACYSFTATESINIQTGGGVDVVVVQGGTTGFLNISNGAGADVVFVDVLTMNAGQPTSISMGENNDTLFIGAGTFQSPLNVDGEGGKDSLFFQSSVVTPNGFNSINFERQLELEDVLADNKLSKRLKKFQKPIQILLSLFDRLNPT